MVLKVATRDRVRKKENGEKPEYATDWHWVVGWEEQASDMERSFVKSSRVLDHFIVPRDQYYSFADEFFCNASTSPD